MSPQKGNAFFFGFGPDRVHVRPCQPDNLILGTPSKPCSAISHFWRGLRHLDPLARRRPTGRQLAEICDEDKL